LEEDKNSQKECPRKQLKCQHEHHCAGPGINICCGKTIKEKLIVKTFLAKKVLQEVQLAVKSLIIV